MKHTTRHTLSVALAGDKPPSEFRIFTAGRNETTKGTFLFDGAAAKSVMAAYDEHGVDLAIDLEHQMLDGDTSADPTARDARGWCRLEVRPDGSLWAVGVRWTPDGAARLTEKRQRYVSPAFEVDPKTKRVTRIINVAMTALPATHRTPALVAASGRTKAMDSTLVKKALDALISGDAKACQEILKDLLAAAASAGDPDADTEDAPPPVGDGGTDEGTEPAAVAASLMRITGTRSAVSALAHVRTLSRELQTIQAERDEYASAERVRLCSKLVVDAGRAPASVWATSDARIPKPHLQRMSITELRQHVEEEIGAAVGTRRSVLKPATERLSAHDDGGPVDAYGNTAAQRRICKEYGTDPATFARLKAMQGTAVPR